MQNTENNQNTHPKEKAKNPLTKEDIIIAALGHLTAQVSLITKALLPNLDKAGLPVTKRSFLSTNEAMRETGYKDKTSFLASMEKGGVRHVALHAKKFVWDPSDLNQWKTAHTKNERGPYVRIT